MIAIFFGGLCLIVLYIAGTNGEWGTFAVFAVILLIVILMAVAGNVDARAHNNWHDYWAEGGPDRERRRR